jgi:hypothetical protein
LETVVFEGLGGVGGGVVLSGRVRRRTRAAAARMEARPRKK